MQRPVPLPRRMLAELVGSGLLVTVVVGSGIAAQRLSPDDVGLQLLENSTATVFGLTVLIVMLGPPCRVRTSILWCRLWTGGWGGGRERARLAMSWAHTPSRRPAGVWPAPSEPT